ncbi:DUF6182 family protein [Kibdelosporangium aridum]|uniref:DUF6182 family protein n=1 Tax=Kibdelosporangium aridum TaxID=2030 RepID=UPI000525ACD4
MLNQGNLFEALARRVAQAAPDVAPASLPGSFADIEAAVQSAPAVTAVAVVRRFDPAVFCQSSVDFALSLDAQQREVWFRAFTRTLFLSGNPVNLAKRFRFTTIAQDGSVGWLAPSPDARLLGLRRLLKLFDVSGDLELPGELTVVVPAGAPWNQHLRVYIATAGLRLPEYLVHLNHTLAEAVLGGVVTRGSVLTLVHVPRITAEAGPYDRLRVHWDTRSAGTERSGRLRAYAGLRKGFS